MSRQSVVAGERTLLPPRRAHSALLVVLALAACGPSSPAQDDDRAGADPDADRLAPTLTIGVDEGPDEYMLGQIEAVAATGEWVFVLNRSVDRVRVYDAAGAYVRDIGGGGEGPGEFSNPYLMTLSPGGERLFVRDQRGLEVFGVTGEHLGSFGEPGGLILPLVAMRDGRVLVPTNWNEDGRFRSGLLPVGPDGERGEPILVPEWDWNPWQLVARRGDGTRYAMIPYAPELAWTITPDGLLVSGEPARYRFEIRQDDHTTVVERPYEPIDLLPEEAAWHRAMITGQLRGIDPEWQWTARDIPATKPAFAQFFGDAHGRIWVQRIAATVAIEDCDADPTAVWFRAPRPCWQDVFVLDAFDVDGAYLGTLSLPRTVRLDVPPAFTRGHVFAVVEDGAGVRRVARFAIPFADGESTSDGSP